MKIYSILQHIAALACLLAACGPLSAPTLATPTDAVTPTEAVPTATIQWFPPTPTATPRALLTPTPTPDYLGTLGEVLLEDRFDSGGWSPAFVSSATLSLNRNRLTLAVPPGLYLTALRDQPSLGDFYAEITARVNLCQGADEYGLLFRAASGNSAYRLVLNCQGQARLDRLRDGERAYLVSWQPSGDVPPGAPGEVRLGVRASGGDLRVFLNGRFLFSARDPLFPSGRLGVYARSAGNTPVSISFSDLIVRRLQP